MKMVSTLLSISTSTLSDCRFSCMDTKECGYYAFCDDLSICNSGNATVTYSSTAPTSMKMSGQAHLYSDKHNNFGSIPLVTTPGPIIVRLRRPSSDVAVESFAFKVPELRPTVRDDCVSFDVRVRHLELVFFGGSTRRTMKISTWVIKSLDGILHCMQKEVQRWIRRHDFVNLPANTFCMKIRTTGAVIAQLSSPAGHHQRCWI